MIVSVIWLCLCLLMPSVILVASVNSAKFGALCAVTTHLSFLIAPNILASEPVAAASTLCSPDPPYVRSTSLCLLAFWFLSGRRFRDGMVASTSVSGTYRYPTLKSAVSKGKGAGHSFLTDWLVYSDATNVHPHWIEQIKSKTPQ